MSYLALDCEEQRIVPSRSQGRGFETLHESGDTFVRDTAIGMSCPLKCISEARTGIIICTSVTFITSVLLVVSKD